MEENKVLTGEKKITQEQLNALANHEAFVENSRRMYQIVAEMREIPELPSEQIKDTHALEKVEFPPTGGVLTYMSDYEHPYKGFPFSEFVEKIDIVKKIQRSVLSSLFHSLKNRRLSLIPLIFAPWLINVLVKSFTDSFHRLIDRFKIKTERYSDAMRELHRAFSFEFADEDVETRENRFKIRDIMCMFLEFDNAYRFRFQDIIVELDKIALRKNPSKELLRLFNLMSSREQTQEIKDTWKLVKYFLPVYLRFNKPLRQNIIEIFTRLDLEKVKLSVEDEYFSSKRLDYKFGFMK